MPFITEEIWHKVKAFAGVSGDTIMLQAFPQFEQSALDYQAEAEINWMKEVIVAVRNIRAESNIPPSKGLDLLLRNLSEADQNALENNRTLIQAMAKLDAIRVLEAGKMPHFQWQNWSTTQNYLYQWQALSIKKQNLRG